MATYDSPSLTQDSRASEAGNVNVQKGTITGNGAAGTAASGSVLRLCKLPAGIRVIGTTLFMSAATSSLTGVLGFVPVVTAAGPTADDDAFMATGAIATEAVFRNNRGLTMPAVLTEEVYVTLTTGGATLASTTIVAVEVLYEHLGRP